MLPVFDEYKKMLADFNIDLSNYDTNKLWIDRLIIRGFDKNGNDRKILRLKVNDNLEYEYKFYANPPENEELETWEDTYNRLKFIIDKKEEESISVIKASIKKYPEALLVLFTSMGKDSKLLEYILRKVTTNYKIVFNNTTCDSADVYKEVKQRPEVEIVTPKDKSGNNLSLYHIAEQYGFATRHHRWCCGIFKELATKNYLFEENNVIQYLGMRNEESFTRSNYQFEQEDDRFDKRFHKFLPIRKWTELELWLYTLHHNISINSKYLKGYHRVGCHIVCPYYTKSTWVLDKYWYKKQYDRFHNKLSKIFWDKELCCRLNCTENEYHLNWNGGQVRKTPTKEVIEEFMKYKGFDDYNLASQYFEKKCDCCGKNVYKKDEVAMNLKFFGKEINSFKCKKCLLKHFNWDKEQWDNQVEMFKQNNCILF